MIVVSQDGEKVCNTFSFTICPIDYCGNEVPQWEIKEYGEKCISYYVIMNSDGDYYATYDEKYEAENHLNNLIIAYAKNASYFKFTKSKFKPDEVRTYKSYESEGDEYL